MKNLQIRNMPGDLHRRLKARAAAEGRTLSDFAMAELRRAADRPTLDDLLLRIESRGAVDTAEASADAVRAERESG